MISFFKTIIIWVLLLLSIGSDATKLPSLTNAGQLRGKLPPSSLKTTPQSGLANRLLEAVLKDQLKETPVPSANYVFLEFAPGTLVENFCNGGGHVAFITAVWRTASKTSAQHVTFEATRHELAVRRYNPVTKTQTAYYNEDDYSDSIAAAAVASKYLYLPLGKSGLKVKNFKALNDFIEEQSDKYFETASEYKYITQNCGIYVEEFIPKLLTEHSVMSDIVLAPSKREFAFTA